jgi:hypothetical protein
MMHLRRTVYHSGSPLETALIIPIHSAVAVPHGRVIKK